MTRQATLRQPHELQTDLGEIVGREIAQKSLKAFETGHNTDYDAFVKNADIPVVRNGFSAQINAKAVFLTHYIPLYQVRVLQEIAKSLSDFRILLNTPIEPNRDFRPDWSGLHVEVQKTITLRRRWHHKGAGFNDPLYVHIPYDTISRLKAISPDVVVSHELGARSLAATRYCRRSGAKLVLATFMSEHTEQDRGWMRSKLRRHLVSEADAITFNGPSCRDYLLSLGADESKLFHMPYAADDRNIQNELPQHDEVATRGKLLCIGQLSDRKGVLPVVRQASDFCRDHDERLEISFVGDGPLRSELDRLASGGSLEDGFALDPRLKINILGVQPADQLPRIMREHSVVIAPTLADEWLMVVNEAMHSGMPVIGSIYAQAVTTLVQDDRNGWQYDPLHPHSGGVNSTASVNVDTAPPLSDVLARLMQCDEHSLASMRRNARVDVAGCTPRKSAEGVLSAIRTVLDLNAEPELDCCSKRVVVPRSCHSDSVPSDCGAKA